MAVACLTSAGLGSRILQPEDTRYAGRIDAYFDSGAKLHPACILQPRTAAEVAEAVKALVGAGHKFAVRSGGCANRPASNNIEGGVTIDLGLMDNVHYDPQTGLASLQPGATWEHVYDELEKLGRVVPGGRANIVGVGGLLLGGGITFWTGREGFACDNVVAYEVVLADGSVVTAQAGEHEDLFRVLKGGSNNFGIVTSYVMKTMPSGPLWGGIALRPIESLPAAAQAVESFTTNMQDDPDSTTIFVAGHQPRFGGDVLMNLCFNAAGVEKPKAFDGFFSLPELSSDYTTGKATEITPYSASPAFYYNIWYTRSFKNDASIIQKACELHFALADELKREVADGDFTSHCALQPIPRLYSRLSTAAGGNVLGLDTYPHDGVMVQVSASVKTKALEAWARPKVRAVTEELVAYANTIEDGNMPWVYLNYAAADQETLQSYGPENLAKMRAAASRYDPEAVFQKLCPGGFKISAVQE